MEQTLDSIAYNIFETVRANIKDDDALDIRLIKDWINNYRAKFIKQQLDKMPYDINESFIQTTVLTMSTVDLNTTYETGKKILKSTTELTMPMYWINNTPVFKRVGPVDDSSRKYDVLSQERTLTIGSGRFNKNMIAAKYASGYLWVVSNNPVVKGIRKVSVSGVFQDPTQISGFEDDTTRYPVDRKLRDLIEQSILRDKFSINLINLEDKENDATHKLEQ